jgi:hypothetical protein
MLARHQGLAARRLFLPPLYRQLTKNFIIIYINIVFFSSLLLQGKQKA